MNYPPYPNDPNDPHSQPTTAGSYPQWGQQSGPTPQYPQQPGQPSSPQYPQWGQQAPPPPPPQFPQQGQFPQYPQPGQFGPPPYPPAQPPMQQPPIKPCSDGVLSILFLLNIVGWICAFVPGGVGNFGKSVVTSIVFIMLIIDWKGVLTFDGKINWKKFSGGKRVLLFCLYFAVLPFALLGYFVRRINASTEAKKQKLPVLPARKGRPILAIVVGFFVFIFALAANASPSTGTTVTPAPEPTQQVTHAAPTRIPTQKPTATPTPSPSPTPTPTPSPTPEPTKPPVQQPAPPPPPAQLFVTITSAYATDYSSGSVSVHTLPGAALTISVTYCTGRSAVSGSLQGTEYANSAGDYTWTWKPDTKCKGTATAYVNASLNGQSASDSKDFTVS